MDSAPLISLISSTACIGLGLEPKERCYAEDHEIDINGRFRSLLIFQDQPPTLDEKVIVETRATRMIPIEIYRMSQKDYPPTEHCLSHITKLL